MLDTEQKQAATKELKIRYYRSTKKEKTKILDIFTTLTKLQLLFIFSLF